MKVYISADIEGIAGSTHWDETETNKPDYSAFQAQMTAEVAAACEGALEAGATEIWVKDAHGSARNLLHERLPKEVRLVRGWAAHPFLMMQELNESFDAAMLIGYHSAAGVGGSPLAHTMSGKPAWVLINGQYTSEFLLAAYTAGFVNVPLCFVSGDQALCDTIRAFNSSIHTVATKQGLGDSTINIHPHLAVERIHQNVVNALRADRSQCLVKLPDHFEVEIRYRRHTDAYGLSFYPGAKLKDMFTLQYQTDNFFDLLRLVFFVL
jgi:D-amino peptidase